MAEISLNEVAAVTGGKLEGAAGDMIVSHFHFDTRLVKDPGTLFFALRSPDGDGHQFLDQIQDQKQVAAVIEEGYPHRRRGLPLVRVKDTLKAAHDLARYVRDLFKACRFVGITGSAGKTTTKEFLYQIAARTIPAFRSHVNWNNWIGLPFSMFHMEGSEEVAVFELAMSYPGIGEIDLLAEILRPDVAVILNVFPVHLEFLKNLDNVARGKAEILNYLDADGTALVSGDSDHLEKQMLGRKGQIIRFGRRDSCDIVLEKVERRRNRSILTIRFFGIEDRFTVPVISHTHIENLFAAICAARALGFKHFEIRDAVETIEPLSQRGVIEKARDFTIIDETYNSNPEALLRTLQWVDQEYSGMKIAVLGDMLELGEDESRYHREAGRRFAGMKFSRLVTVGDRAMDIARGARTGGFDPKRIRSFETAAEAGRHLREVAERGAVILLKGSRGIRLEETIEEFKRDR